MALDIEMSFCKASTRGQQPLFKKENKEAMNEVLNSYPVFTVTAVYKCMCALSVS